MEKINESLLQANRECVNRTIPLVAMLGRCRQQYLLYAQNHKTKAEGYRHKADFLDQPERENRLEDAQDHDQKAAVNQGLADEIDETLRQFRASAEYPPADGD